MTSHNDVLALTESLIRVPSITPLDAGCQNLLKARLAKLDFAITELPCEQAENFWAIRGKASPVFVFAGHTDVVPVGALDQWLTPPFVPTIQDNRLYGRGAADMKGSLAAMIVATERFIAKYPDHNGAIGFLITSAEEGPSDLGTPVVLDYLTKINQSIDYCLVGEPSSHNQLGDAIKNGRRGSLNGALTVIGKQGHIAYPELADNPIHRALAALDELCKTQWDQGNVYFAPTSFQISNINSGTGAGNVIPAHLEVLFNFRYSPAVTHEQLQVRLEEVLQRYGIVYQIKWSHSGYSYLTQRDSLVEATSAAIQKHCGITPQLSTHGGTSDGRFISQHCSQVIEFGPTNRTIHQVNENVSIDELNQLTDIYLSILEQILMKEPVC